MNMKMPLHLMEPWLIKNQFIKFNLGESGVEDKTLGEILSLTNTSTEELLKCSFQNNDTYGSLNLRKIIASFYKNVSPENILVTTGSSEAIFIYFQHRFEPGANVITLFPAFQSLYEVPRYIGYEVRTLDLKPEEKFRLNIKRLESLIDSKTKVLILNNPHNPTGMMLTDQEIEELGNLKQKYDFEILADEHYRFIPYGPEKLIPPLYDRIPGVVAVGSMIKCFACVGLRVGWIVGPKKLIDDCRDFKDYTTHTICSVTDFLSQRLLLNWENIVDVHRKWISENIHVFSAFIEKYSNIIDWVKPEGGIVAFPFLKDSSISSWEFAKKLVEKAEVSVLPGEAFEKPGYFRVGFGLNPPVFRAAVQRFSEFVETKAWK